MSLSAFGVDHGHIAKGEPLGAHSVEEQLNAEHRAGGHANRKVRACTMCNDPRYARRAAIVAAKARP